MPPTPVDISEPNEVFIGDTYFPITKPVTKTSITVVPNPVIFGDTAKKGDTQTLSQFIQSSSGGGSGVYQGNARTDAERAWYSECETRFKFLTLPSLETSISKPAGAGSTTDANLFIEFANVVYVAWGSDLYPIVDGTPPTWGTLERSLPAVPTAWMEFRHLLNVASGARIDRRTSGGVWTTLTVDATYLIGFASKIYALGLTSGVWTLRWSAIGDFSEAAPAGGWPIISESNVTPHGMAIYRDAIGNKRIFIATDRGYWIVDENTNTISQSEITWGVDSNAGMTPKPYRDGRLYTTLGGLGVLQTQGGNPMLGQPIGMDRDDGVPSTQQGAVAGLEVESNWLYALVNGNGSSVASSVPDVSPGDALGWAAGMWDDVSTGTTSIMSYDSGPGWHRIWTSNGSGYPGTTMYVSQAYSKKRLYWGADRQVWYVDLPTGLYNPRFNPTRRYTARPCSHVTPWWFFTSELETKLIPHFLIEMLDASATESVDISFATDLDDDAWTPLTTITSNGLSTVLLNDGAGTTGRWWRFKLDLHRDPSNSSARPLVILWGPQFLPMLTAEYGFAFQVAINGAHRDKSAQQLHEALERLSDPAQTPDLVRFSYQDALSSQPQTFYGRIMRFQEQAYTGRDMRGQGTYLVSFIVPSKADAG